MRALHLISAALVSLTACADHDADVDRVGPGPVPDAGQSCNVDPDPKAQLPCDIAQILETRCQRCHQSPAKNGAPFPLLTYMDLFGDYGGPIYQAAYKAVKVDFMPYCAEGSSCAGTVSDGPVQPLSAEQKATLLAYLKCPQPAYDQACP
ncbi:MAG: hypothetical protein IT377_33080 [Polyangiaceae bacterium]|nr:hypothetical protein [Polyangiaceae bacterium]